MLYHWRCHQASTAGNPDSKSYAYEAGRKALEEHFERTGTDARIECMDNPGFYRIKYPVKGDPKVSIVVLDPPDMSSMGRFARALSRVESYRNVEILILLDAPKKNKLILNFIKEHRQTPIKVV